jgi:hypothetical protein
MRQPPGKAVHRVAQFGRPETETEDEGLGARLRIVRAGVVQRHVGVGHALAVFAGFRRQHFLLCGQQRGVAFDDEVGRGLVGFRHVLRDLCHAPLRRPAEIAAVFMQRAVEQREQRRLAGAVAADQTDLLAGVERDGRVVEQHLGAAAQGDVPECDHAGETPAGCPATTGCSKTRDGRIRGRRCGLRHSFRCACLRNQRLWLRP